ncbi:MAG TPA: hypothetical protein VG649_17225, partial [Candidatus Angelobacter sp.]|nr:hypothetical protein [Candidatus Angelobacter sp.]
MLSSAIGIGGVVVVLFAGLILYRGRVYVGIDGESKSEIATDDKSKPEITEIDVTGFGLRFKLKTQAPIYLMFF